jgi:hypothetical protein
MIDWCKCFDDKEPNSKKNWFERGKPTLLQTTSFWAQIWKHYNLHWLTCESKRPMKAFQTKWGMIKHNVVKCVRYYGITMALF